MGSYKVAQYLGVVLMIHAIISAAQYRAEVESADDLRDHIPGDIIFEGIAAFLIASFGYISSHGVFENIHKKKINEEKSFDQFHYRPNFMVFNHRGQCLNHQD
eukprot:CAMPEP_0174363650 /NCGR_PEP_ID=MMETSP0811_2-20130205/69659_1 /TAXON_ID=73025 ORGANISM="Eutreptiella gymnastica-like, Strain CCMP1594" /NCGR_SAMPLE_ID=MMETSP0811_2 /ASSEMBLY_ACC=CAM_ASM_000667 /LENGTH=102 /DNA_ID=CAMNT_0015502525 /DNA_START=38 /DNA_END=346 /DNA_ORIENTATION=-